VIAYARYVVSQGPKPDLRNTADFWRMVWEINAKAIVMVTGVTEGGVEKCARYWPAVLYDKQRRNGEQR
jgi:protein tyrosine phosphatase